MEKRPHWTGYTVKRSAIAGWCSAPKLVYLLCRYRPAIYETYTDGPVRGSGRGRERGSGRLKRKGGGYPKRRRGIRGERGGGDRVSAARAFNMLLFRGPAICGMEAECIGGGELSDCVYISGAS